MIKSELVQRIADHKPDLYQRDAERILDTILQEIVSAMARGNRVELRGFVVVLGPGPRVASAGSSHLN